MGLPKRLIILLCISISAYCQFSAEYLENVQGATQDPSKFRLPNDTVPMHYHVILNPHMSSESVHLEGQTIVTFKVLRPTLRVVLHAKNLEINETRTTLITERGETINPINHKYDSLEMLHLNFARPLTPGNYTAKFEYVTEEEQDLYGFYGSSYRDENDNAVWLIATHFQATFARRVFPCWDEPALKATFQFSIKHYPNYTALSNMPVKAQEWDASDGKIWTNFEVTPTMSTNVLGFIIADYANISNSDGTIRVWTRRNAVNDASYMLEAVVKANEVLSSYLNSTVRVPKMDHVTVPQYSSRATENWGLIVYNEKALLHNSDIHASTMRIANIMTAVHEISHQWFGNLVSPAWWKYYWLSEGIATYMKYYITDMLYENLRLNDLFVVRVQQQIAFNVDDRDNVVPISQDFTTTLSIMLRNSGIIYGKSASVIRMLSHIVTEDVFRTGLLKYLAAHEYSSVTSDDLWYAMQDALDETNSVEQNVNVKKVMDSWIDQTGYPLVTVKRNYTTGEVMAYQEPSPTNRDLRYKRWWIPVSYTIESQANFSRTTPSHWLTPNKDHVTIGNAPASDWVIVNLQQSGYYRVNYDTSNWMKIVKYLNSDNYTGIHVLNRAQLIDDAFKLLSKNRLNPDIFVRLTNYLSREIDYIPWESAFNIFGGASKYLRIPEAAAVLNPHILRLMHNYVESLGYDERINDTFLVKSARREALSWACRLGHEKCKEQATTRLIAYLEDPVGNTISPDLRHSIYCTGLMKANQSIWNKLFALTRHPLARHSLEYLSCSENSTIIKDYLSMLLSNKTVLAQYDFSDALNFLDRNNPVNTDVELEFIINNWDRLSQSEYHPNTILTNIIEKVNRQDQFNKLRTFLEANRIDCLIDLSYREAAVRKLRDHIATINVWLENATGEN